MPDLRKGGLPTITKIKGGIVMEAYMQWAWIAALVIFTIAEASTGAIVSLWFMGGSLVAFLLAVFGLPVWLQILCFVVVSLVLLLLLRPRLRSMVEKRKIPTNSDSLVGKTVLVTEDIDNLRNKGVVRVHGVDWTAFSADGKPISKETPVRILSVHSAKLCVEPAEIV